MDWGLEVAALKFAFELLHGSMPATPGEGVVVQDQDGLVTVQPSTRQQGFPVNPGPAITLDPLWNLGSIVECKGNVPSAKRKGEGSQELHKWFTALLRRQAPLKRGEHSAVKGKESLRRCRFHDDSPSSH
jgi:hypothetical protein